MYTRHLVISSADKLLEARYRTVKLMLNATTRSAKVKDIKLFHAAKFNRLQAANSNTPVVFARRTSRLA